ncbi:MAG: hypothetical protein V2A79_10975 [Planctomycetota bacterium]
MKLSKDVVGNIGLFYVCYQLCLRGWNVMPTTRNARGIDVLVYSQDNSQKLSVQVKTLSHHPAVPLGQHLDNLFADFIVVCCNVATSTPECFLLTPAEVRRLAGRSGKEGRVSYWLERRDYEQEKFRANWDRMGDPGMA